MDIIFGERFYLELDVVPVDSGMQTKIPGIKERNFAKKINPKNIVNKTIGRIIHIEAVHNFYKNICKIIILVDI